MEGGIYQLFLALICSSILSGYVLLRIFRLSVYFSRLEIAVLSFLLSFIFSGLSTLSFLFVDEITRSIIMPVLFILLGAGSIVLSRYRRTRSNDGTEIRRPRSLCSGIDVLSLATCIIFYMTFFYLIYPAAAVEPSTDSSRHYSYSITLSRTPDVYAGNVLVAGDVSTGYGYLLFHAFQAALHNLSGLDQTVTHFQTIQIGLNIFIPLSIYTLAKRFFGNLDKRIPALSTLFYTVFSNFTFIYFAQLKLLDFGNTEFQLLSTDVAEKSYSGIVNFIQPFHFFTPLSVAYMLFILAFLLLRVPDLPRFRFIGFYSVLIFAMYYTHLPEAVLFVFFIATFSFFYKNCKPLRINGALVSLLIGSTLAGIFFAYASIGWKSEFRDIRISTAGILSMMLPLLVVLSTLLWRQKVLPYIKFFEKVSDFFARTKVLLAISISLVTVFLFGLLMWLVIVDFKTSRVLEIGVMPWFIYPLILGMVGLLALLSIRYVRELFAQRRLCYSLVGYFIFFYNGKSCFLC